MLDGKIPADLLAQLREELEILDEIVEPLNVDKIMEQKQTPVWFGSGFNNFGVQLFLDKFIDIAQTPRGRVSNQGPVAPESEDFSGFVFKLQVRPRPAPRRPAPRRAALRRPAPPCARSYSAAGQANMDPKHRDRIAFVRVCSGRFNKDMQVVPAFRSSL